MSCSRGETATRLPKPKPLDGAELPIRALDEAAWSGQSALSTRQRLSFHPDDVREDRRSRLSMIAMAKVGLVAVSGVALASCSDARTLPIISPCRSTVTVMLIDQDGNRPLAKGVDVSPKGTTVGVGTTDRYFAIVDASGAVLAETSLPDDRLDRRGKHSFPPLRVPERLCPS